MPYDFTGIGSENEPGRVQRIAIEKWKRFMYRPFDGGVLISIGDLINRKVDMELRPCRLAVLFLHMISAWNRRIAYGIKELFQLLEGNPVSRII